MPLESLKDLDENITGTDIAELTNLSPVDSLKDTLRNRASDVDCDLESSKEDRDPKSSISTSTREALLIEAYKHEALRRRQPIIWIPQDPYGIADAEIASMPRNVQASSKGARLNDKGQAEFFENPPDFVRSDHILL